MFLFRICNIPSRKVSHCFAKQFGHRTVRGFSSISSSWGCSSGVKAGVEVVVETLVAVVVVVGCIHYNSVHYLVVLSTGVPDQPVGGRKYKYVC